MDYVEVKYLISWKSNISAVQLIRIPGSRMLSILDGLDCGPIFEDPSPNDVSFCSF